MQKNWKSKLKQLLFATMFLLVLSGNGNVIPVQAQVTSVEDVEEAQPGKFENTEDGWIYIYEDGTQAADCLLDINEKTYYFSEEGIRQYGWQYSRIREIVGTRTKTIITLNGKTYISVTFGARTTDGRWADARKLLSYARNLK